MSTIIIFQYYFPDETVLPCNATQHHFDAAIELHLISHFEYVVSDLIDTADCVNVLEEMHIDIGEVVFCETKVVIGKHRNIRQLIWMRVLQLRTNLDIACQDFRFHVVCESHRRT